jgi:chromosome segregation ATPase
MKQIDLANQQIKTTGDVLKNLEIKKGELAQLVQDMNVRNTELREIENSIVKARSASDQLIQQKNNLNAEIKSLSDKRDNLTAQLESANQQLKSAGESVKDWDVKKLEYSKLVQETASRNHEKRELEKEVDSLRKKKADHEVVREDLDHLKTQRDQLEARVNRQIQLSLEVDNKLIQKQQQLEEIGKQFENSRREQLSP